MKKRPRFVSTFLVRGRNSRRRLFIVLSSAMATVAWAAACGDGSTEPPAPPPDPPRPTTVTVTPATAELTALGETVQLRAEVRDQDGQAMAGASVTWASTSAAVATVSAAGLVTAVGNGAATITAAAGAASGTAVVTVTQSVRSVTVSPSADTIAPGDTLRLEAEARDENGHRVAEARFTWSSSNTSVATVESGLVRGVGDGMATLTATAGDAHGTADVTVVNPDRGALEALYNATDGPNWINADYWLTDAPLEEWYGVDTDGFGRVVGLDLSGRWDSDEGRLVRHGLEGSIPPQLATLGRLRRLHLSYNNLTGSIPAEFGNLGQLKSLHLDGNDLSGPVPPELARLANLESLGLEHNELTGPIPPELGRLTNLRVLWLLSNRLTGPVPHELGRLANLEGLDLSHNDLSGPIPQSLLKLTKLTTLKFGNNRGLCVPGTSAFARWLDGAEYRDETPTRYCNESDAAVLDDFYETAGGSNWTNSTGWRASPVLEEWYGVDADTLGRVTGLDLSNNGVSGKIPTSLSELTRLTVLRINGNDLSGRLPLALTALSLRELHYADTELCTPTNGSFHDWLKTIASHEGTGVECGFAFSALEVSEPAPLTSIGETVELLVTGISDDAVREVDNALVDWKSSDPDVATVIGGVVTAVRGGNTTITASYEEHTAESVVSVWISTLSEGSVRVLYVVPADKEFRDDYSQAISKAIVDVQGWYGRQLGGPTYDLYSVVPEVCHLPRDEDYYRHEETWSRVETDVQRNCAPVWDEGRTPYSWALYVDVHESCDGEQQLGAGADRVTMLPGYDLALMVKPGQWTFCDGAIDRTYGSVLGGFAHELAHTFLIPHPPECDPVVTEACDPELLMAFGWELYPDTYFSETEKAMLRRSQFVR